MLERRIPSIAAFRENTEAGALISYGFDLMGLFYDIASYVHRIAGGAKPGDLPVLQSTKVELIINLKTAKALGLTVPLPLLGRADEVSNEQLCCWLRRIAAAMQRYRGA